MTEQELKDRCTPEFIKWMCEYAEGFSYNGNKEFIYLGYSYPINSGAFPLLIHRAVEGWNKKNHTADRRFDKHIRIEQARLFEFVDEMASVYEFINYQPESLTQAECAMLRCLLDIYERDTL